MRIGILTQPLGNNYGGILQNWALQQVLQDLGHQVITLDQSPSYPLWRYFLTKARLQIKRILGNKVYLPHRPIKGRAINPITADFIFANISLTHPLNGNFRNVIQKYKLNAVIVGSDQVWRPKYNPDIRVMFLSFVPQGIKKIAYSASFGNDEWEFSTEETSDCSALVKLFNAISVREYGGATLCQQFFSVQPYVTLDPTLLIESQRYENLCACEPKSKRQFLAFYCLDIDNAKSSIAHQIAERECLEIQYFSAHEKLNYSVSKWLAFFRDASYVVTDSYHGTIFAIIFKKQFVNVGNSERGNSRIDSLYKILSIERSTKDAKLNNIQINYSAVERVIESQRKYSIAFLENALVKS